jgi:hypothetical protein
MIGGDKMLKIWIMLLVMVFFSAFSLATAEEMERWSPVLNADLILKSMKNKDQVEQKRRKKMESEEETEYPSESVGYAYIVDAVPVLPLPVPVYPPVLIYPPLPPHSNIHIAKRHMEPIAVVRDLENKPIKHIVQEIQNQKIQTISATKHRQHTIMENVGSIGKTGTPITPKPVTSIKQPARKEGLSNNPITKPNINSFKAPTISSPSFTPNFKAPSITPGFAPSFKAPSFGGGFGRIR